MLDKQQNAQATYEKFCQLLDEIGYRYRKDDERLAIFFITNGDDIPIETYITFDVERELLNVYSPLPFEVPETGRIDMALPVNLANLVMSDGCFEYNVIDGTVRYHLSNSYKNVALDKDVLIYLFRTCICVVDDFNDKLYALSEGNMTLNEYIDFLRQLIS